MNQGDALLHAEQPQSMWPKPGLFRVKSHSIIRNRDRQPGLRPSHLHIDSRRRGMASHVAEAFLRDAIETGCDFLGDGGGNIIVSKAPLDMASRCEFIHQPLQSDRKAEVIENGRMKLISQMTHDIRQFHYPVLYRANGSAHVIW